MIIYRYNLKKYMRTVSTWIMLVITLALVGVMTWAVSLLSTTNETLTAEEILSLNKVTMITSFQAVGSVILIMVIIFAAFKSVQLFRDEINEGSLLLVISKPVSRRRILQQKWMALLTIFFIFIIPVVALHTGILLGRIKDSGLRKDIYWGFFSEVSISFILFLLFSSLFLLMSLKLGVKSILGISFAFVILLFVSQTIQALTYNAQFSIANSRAGFNVPAHFKNTTTYTPKYYNLEKDVSATNIADSYKTVPKIYQKTNNIKNNFSKVWPIALSYQVSQLNSILFGKDFKSTEEEQGKPMRVRSSSNFDFAKTTNHFYIDYGSHDVATNLVSYLNSHSTTWKNNKMTLVKDFQDFTNSIIKAQLSQSRETTLIPSSIVNFAAVSATYKTDAETLYNVNNELTSWYARYNLKNLVQPERDDLKDNNNLNALFGTLVSYYLTNESFKNLGLNKLYLNDSMTFDYFKAHPSTVCFSSNNNNPTVKGASKFFYKNWINYNEYCSNFKNRLTETQKNQITDGDWTKLNQYFYTVDLVNYVNPYILLAVYITIVVTLTPLTYYMFRKSDFS